jgi:RecA-family ATPase
LKDKKSPIFTEQSINQIFAWRGLGKTNIGFGLTAAFAKGGDLLNWEAPQRSRVLYIEGELPAAQAQERWKQIIGETNGYARLITIDKQPGNTIPSLATAVGMARIEKTLTQLESDGFKTDVLFLDSISTLFNMNANDEESWLAVQTWLIKLRSRGLCIFWFHHAGKSGMSRSHSKSEDMLDVSIKLEAPKEPEAGCLHVLMSYDKARAGYSEPQQEIKMHRVHSICLCQTKAGIVGRPGDRVRWESKAPGDQKRSEAEQRFRSGKSNADIAEELDITPSTVRVWRKRWKDDHEQQTIN